ncbi:hypothetical protein, partial [Xylella fastidiosa]
LLARLSIIIRNVFSSRLNNKGNTNRSRNVDCFALASWRGAVRAGDDVGAPAALTGTKSMFSDSLAKDAQEWVKALRLNYSHFVTIRNLRVGETFWIAYFSGPGVSKDVLGHCEAYIKRVKGGYTFNAIWTMAWGKPLRTHVMTSGNFKLLPSNRIVFKSDEDLASEKTFRLVCRYASYINRHGKEYGIAPMYIGAPEHRHKMWRGAVVLKDGYTKYGVNGPEPMGLEAIVESAIALGVVPFDADDEVAIDRAY